MAPDTSFQVYTLHGYLNGEALALAWALLPNKSQQTYAELFTALADAFVRNFGDVGRRTFLTDFETAAINAIRATFPDSVLKGCTFHYRQAITRKVQAVSQTSQTQLYCVIEWCKVTHTGVKGAEGGLINMYKKGVQDKLTYKFSRHMSCIR